MNIAGLAGNGYYTVGIVIRLCGVASDEKLPLTSKYCTGRGMWTLFPIYFFPFEPQHLSTSIPASLYLAIRDPYMLMILASARHRVLSVRSTFRREGNVEHNSQFTV